jgi:hypothetical protein
LPGAPPEAEPFFDPGLRRHAEAGTETDEAALLTDEVTQLYEKLTAAFRL